MLGHWEVLGHWVQVAEAPGYRVQVAEGLGLWLRRLRSILSQDSCIFPYTVVVVVSSSMFTLGKDEPVEKKLKGEGDKKGTM